MHGAGTQEVHKRDSCYSLVPLIISTALWEAGTLESEWRKSSFLRETQAVKYNPLFSVMNSTEMLILQNGRSPWRLKSCF